MSGRRCAVVVTILVFAGTLAIASPSLASPGLTATPDSFDFGNGDIHTQTQTQVNQTSITFNNGTADTVTISSVEITGSNPADFQLQPFNCPSVAASDKCQIGVRFAPTAVGPRSATLAVTDDTGSTDVALSGTGVTGTLSASPAELTFTPRPYTQGGETQGLNLSTGPEAGVQTTSASITGPNASSFFFAYGNNCFNQFFFPNNSCGLGIGFQPSGPGTYEAQLEIANDGSSSPLVVPLRATALRGAHLTITPAEVAFGDVVVGREAARTVTVANDGDAPTQVGETLVLTGLPRVLFLTDDACTLRQIAPGGSCRLTAKFKPSFAGPVNASVLLITGDGPRPVETIGLNGTGVPAPGPGGGPAPAAPAASLAGEPVAGGRLSCRPAGYAPGTRLTYGWLRNGRAVRGATRASLRLTDADVGARFACRVTPSSPASARAVTSPRSARVAPLDLSGQPGAFVGRRARLALRVHGGVGESSLVAVSARYGMRALAVRLPAGLRLDPSAGRTLGRIGFKPVGGRARAFDLTGARTRSRAVTVAITPGGVRVSGLPSQVGVVRLRFSAGVLGGSGGTARVTTTLRGDRRSTSVRGTAAWRR